MTVPFDIEVDADLYEEVDKIAKENGTTVEEICKRYIELCVKENGMVVWQEGFDNPYTVIRDKEEAQAYIRERGGMA